MEDKEKHANLIDQVVASLKMKFGSMSPPIPVAEELHALQNVATKLKDPDAEVVEHAPFAPSYGGRNSTLDTVIMPREGVPVDAKGNDAKVETAGAGGVAGMQVAGTGEAQAAGLAGKPEDTSPDEPALGGTRSGHDLNINAGPKDPPQEV